MSLGGIDVARRARARAARRGLHPAGRAAHRGAGARGRARHRGAPRHRRSAVLRPGAAARTRRSTSSAATRFRDLSGGMRQKLLAALALATEAPILVCDEPTANLDRSARGAFFEQVAARGKQRHHRPLLAPRRGDRAARRPRRRARRRPHRARRHGTRGPRRPRRVRDPAAEAGPMRRHPARARCSRSRAWPARTRRPPSIPSGASRRARAARCS